MPRLFFFGQAWVPRGSAMAAPIAALTVFVKARVEALVVAVLSASLLMPLLGQAAPDASALASDRGCFSCHGLVRKQVGPGFAQIAARYRTDADAAARLAAKVRRGSVGAWGRVIMPPQTDVSEEESKRLVTWILSQPAPP